jgi:hypothetical protein
VLLAGPSPIERVRRDCERLVLAGYSLSAETAFDPLQTVAIALQVCTYAFGRLRERNSVSMISTKPSA